MGFWNADNTAEAIRLWNDGKSGEEIKSALGARSRNAVLGKLFRAGSMNDPARPKPRSSARSPHRRGPSGRPPRKSTPAIPVLPAPDTSMAVHLLDTAPFDRRCRFPLWDDNEQAAFLFCGHNVAHETTSYCAFHHQLCHGEGTKSERNVVSIRVNTNAPEFVADIAAEATLAA